MLNIRGSQVSRRVTRSAIDHPPNRPAISLVAYPKGKFVGSDRATSYLIAIAQRYQILWGRVKPRSRRNTPITAQQRAGKNRPKAYRDIIRFGGSLALIALPTAVRTVSGEQSHLVNSGRAGRVLGGTNARGPRDPLGKTALDRKVLRAVPVREYSAEQPVR